MFFSWRQQGSISIREIKDTEEDAVAEEVIMMTAEVAVGAVELRTRGGSPGLILFKIRGLMSQMRSSPSSTHMLLLEISLISRMPFRGSISPLLNTSRSKMYSLKFLETNSQSTWMPEIASKRKQESISTLDRASLLIWARRKTLERRKRPSESTRNLKR
jgi:hypothetical protein